MKNISITHFIILLVCTETFAAVNTMHVRNGYARNGEQTTVFVDVKNDEPFHSFQCDITFPTQATVVTSAILLTYRQTDQTLSWNLVSGTTWRFIGVSGSKTPFIGHSGPVLQIGCTLNGVDGSFPMTLSTVRLVNSAFQNIATGFSNGSANIYTTPARTAVRIWLEGFYTAAALRTNLRANGLVPYVSPYPISARTATAVPTTISDWILLELRSAPTGAPLQYRAYLLNSDGYLCDMDGVTTNLDLHMSTGNYYLILHHRNHCTVSSSSSVTMNGISVPTYDFTDLAGKYYNLIAALLPDGDYGMPAGEITNDGSITSADYVKWYKKKRTSPALGYYTEDLTGDGNVDNADFILWQNNSRTGMRSAIQ